MADRTTSDKLSGVGEYDPADFPDIPAEELEEHWTTFKAFDLDDSGFITVDNLEKILETLECPLTQTAIENMVSEVAILCRHENDKMLSFRDFIKCMQYDQAQQAHNQLIDSAEEAAMMGLEIEDREKAVTSEKAEVNIATSEAAAPSAEACEAEEDVVEAEQVSKWRGASIMAVLALAKPRLKASAQAAEISMFEEAMKAVEQEPATVAETAHKSVAPKSVKEMSFQERLAQFKRIEKPPTGVKIPDLGSEDIHKATIKNKLAAFEAAKANAKDQVIFKKTWKIHHHGTYNKKTKFVSNDGQDLKPPPPRRLSALLRS